MKEKIDALKGRKVIIYARVSTEEQEGTLGDQIKTIKAGLKALGYKGKPSIYQEQASGTKLHREQFDLAIQEGMKSKKPAVMVVRDIQRFTRDPYHLGVIYQPMREVEFPVMSIQEPLVLGTLREPQPSSDLIAPIMISAGGSEVTTRKKQTLAGMKESKKRGISGGSPIQLYANELNPFRELLRLSESGIGQNESARRLSRSTSWVQKSKKKLYSMDEYLRNKWLEVTDLIRDMEVKHGNGIGNRATVRMKTVRRMTSGFLFTPNNFPAPTQEDLDNYYNNYNDFKPKRGR